MPVIYVMFDTALYLSEFSKNFCLFKSTIFFSLKKKIYFICSFLLDFFMQQFIFSLNCFAKFPGFPRPLGADIFFSFNVFAFFSSYHSFLSHEVSGKSFIFYIFFSILCFASWQLLVEFSLKSDNCCEIGKSLCCRTN